MSKKKMPTVGQLKRKLERAKYGSKTALDAVEGLLELSDDNIPIIDRILFKKGWDKYIGHGWRTYKTKKRQSANSGEPKDHVNVNKRGKYNKRRSFEQEQRLQRSDPVRHLAEERED